MLKGVGDKYLEKAFWGEVTLEAKAGACGLQSVQR